LIFFSHYQQLVKPIQSKQPEIPAAEPNYEVAVQTSRNTLDLRGCQVKDSCRVEGHSHMSQDIPSLGQVVEWRILVSECWHAGPKWSMTLHLTCWSFFWGLETHRVLPSALGRQGRLGGTLRGFKFFKIMFMFILFFLSYDTLDILLDSLGALDNQMGVSGLLTFIFIFIDF
jgi:hypothetical protein